MKNMAEHIHIVDCGETFPARLAQALQRKGYSLSCSGCPDELIAEMQQAGVKLCSLQQLRSEGVEIELIAGTPQADNEDVKYAEAEHLRIIPVADLLAAHIDGKAMVTECNTRYPGRILAIIRCVLQAQTKKCDYVSGMPAAGLPDEISLSENTRICLLNGDWLLRFDSRNRKSNILILSSLYWRESKIYPTFESYLEARYKMVKNIDRNGILIYNQTVTAFHEWAQSVREDITAIPFKAHTCRKEGGRCFLTYAKSEIELPFSCDEDLLSDISAARLACRQLGVTEKAFYEKIASATFLGE